MLVFQEGVNLEDPKKNPEGNAGTYNKLDKLDPHTCMTLGWN